MKFGRGYLIMKVLHQIQAYISLVLKSNITNIQHMTNAETGYTFFLPFLSTTSQSIHPSPLILLSTCSPRGGCGRSWCEGTSHDFGRNYLTPPFWSRSQLCFSQMSKYRQISDRHQNKDENKTRPLIGSLTTDKTRHRSVKYRLGKKYQK